MIDARNVPVDPASADRLAAQGLVYRLIDTASDADSSAFIRADARGFLGAEPEEDVVVADRAGIAERRNVGVFAGEASGEGAWPVATVNSWVTPLTVPGGEIDMWAISSVTVSGTHRRRGIARALLEGELRAASAVGVPIAGLTATEATIYGRYGFAPAIPVSRLKIHTRRAGWAAADPTARIEYVAGEQLAHELAEVHESTRRRRAGDIAGWELRWTRLAGVAPGNSAAKSVRGVRAVDVDGRTRGVLVYQLKEISGVFRFELAIQHLAAIDEDAEAALWRFALQHDLVDAVTADLRPVDDAVIWRVADQRAVENTVHDHGWLRILDVPAVLTSRSYRAPLDAVLRVRDDLGFAAGTWRLAVADGTASVTATDATPDIEMDAATLAALHLGGVSATRLRAAGRLDAAAPVAASIDDAFRTTEAPLLSIWY